MKIIIEGATLVEKLETIKNTIYLSEEDKKSLLGQILDEWRERYQLVEEAARGEISIPDTTEELLRPYHGWRIALPIIRGRGYNKRLEELNLHKLIGGYMLTPNSQLSYQDRVVYWVIDKCMSPVGAALFAAASIVGAKALFIGGEKELGGIIGNLTFLGNLAYCTLPAGLTLGSWMRYEHVKEIRKKARDLHAIIHEHGRIF